MFDGKKLWRDRAGSRMKEFSQYLRYIFNGHIVIVLLFLIGSAAYYYHRWIDGLSSGFPASLIMAVIIGIFLTYSPVYNFLLEADRIFLLPLEDKLKGYFLRSGIVSLIFQGYILLMVLAVLMPVYAKVSGSHLFIPFFLVLLVVKGWNVSVVWRIQYFVKTSVHNWDWIVRYFVNTGFAYLLFKQANSWLLIILGIVMAFYYWFFFSRTRNIGLKWDLLIEKEEKRVASFYRLANMFTDVPKLKDTIKRRRWLDWVVMKLAFQQKNTYHYLYVRTFLRSGDYLGLFLRLTIIGALAVYFLTFGFGQILLCILFLYLTGFQLLPLWKHHQYKLWVDLYPITENIKQIAFQFLLQTVLGLEAVIFALLILIKGDITYASIGLAAGLLFNWLFVHVYAKKRL
ncbi:ABC transporter permease [Neobacillus fumarioli]|uniref:ABC transporter permease n=1 Tax=Neobacillus fumarioli TaxID=105229 RepID=UPI000836722D|nr:ABC transporter permease [Neobacillus fumarioli]